MSDNNIHASLAVTLVGLSAFSLFTLTIININDLFSPVGMSSKDLVKTNIHSANVITALAVSGIYLHLTTKK